MPRLRLIEIRTGIVVKDRGNQEKFVELVFFDEKENEHTWQLESWTEARKIMDDVRATFYATDFLAGDYIDTWKKQRDRIGS